MINCRKLLTFLHSTCGLDGAYILLSRFRLKSADRAYTGGEAELRRRGCLRNIEVLTEVPGP